ncbi:multidrug effflux MFS transporter [Legionella israelensis]|uniref:Multidrug resistance protein, MFS superfamily n=1 Tax=Legionella israelensis TaxID=454 RepID=A0A0W0VLQ6_9GAMM|nr:multidrug effflux MFS transporter [Legionella israelensis]KTD21016.1 multidrug resistance protein, MFS superfamily [Legionella israelensis]QBS09022.1 MFS transporter [Legionella israelensis]SCY39939.1 drug resistance transporter, Bcr/CflA subfamily [Legionella israelensis DSM 19235]STX58728.1 multidrug resistance protein, MFS superfamily [Legionella israelensis]
MTKKYYGILPNIIVPLGGFGTDIYVPSMPAMVAEFNASRSEVQLTMTAYVAAMGFGQLLAGPISDALGRKKLILISLVIQTLTVIGIILSPSIYWVIFNRFLQGLAAAFMIVPGRAILNDCFSDDELKKQFNYLTISFALAPIIAPLIGGICQEYFGWQASFYFILFYAVILLILVSLTYEETIPAKKKFKPSDIFHNYVHIFSDRKFVMMTLFVSILFGFSSLTSVLGPFIFVKHLGVAPLHYGYIALFFGFGWFCGNVTNRIFFLVQPISKLRFSLICHFLTTLVLLGSSLTGIYSLIPTITAFFLYIYAAGLVFPLMVGEGLALFPTLAASSNACLFASTWIVFAIYTGVATFIPLNNLIILSLVFLGINLASILLYQDIKKNF